MNYAVGHCVDSRDLFLNFPVEKLKITKKECIDIFPDGNKRDLAASIFITSFQMVINDIIDNNTHFKLPTLGRTQSYIYMKRTSGDKFKKAFKKGKWRDIDFLETNFSGYQLVFEIQSQKRLPREKPIYLAPQDKQKITDNANSGKQY